MAIVTDYSELKTEVANNLERDDLTDDIPGFIDLAQDRIAKVVRAKEMEATSSIPTVADQENYDLPTGYLELKRVYYDDGTAKTRLEYRSPVHYWSIYGNTASGTPRVFTIEGDEILLGPAPDAIQSIELLYYARLTNFSGDSDTNALLTNATGLYLYGALLEAASFLNDDSQLLRWTQMFENAVDIVNGSDITDRYSGDPAAMRLAAQNNPRMM